MWIRPRRDSQLMRGLNREQHFSLHSHHIYYSLCAATVGLEKKAFEGVSHMNVVGPFCIPSMELRGQQSEIKSVLNSVVKFVQLCQCTHIKKYIYRNDCAFFNCCLSNPSIVIFHPRSLRIYTHICRTKRQYIKWMLSTLTSTKCSICCQKMVLNLIFVCMSHISIILFTSMRRCVAPQ